MVSVADLLVTLIAISCVAAAPPPSLDEQTQTKQPKVCTGCHVNTADLKVTADLTLPVSQNHQCVPNAPTMDVCSKDGYCGSKSAQCGAGCQEGYGICKLPTFPKRPDTDPNASVNVFGNCKTKNTIALMFEGGPNKEYMPRILDALNEKGAKASFLSMA
ncbi:hypothetical protein BASA83_009827 [Batrachochytrium salamandrivorans]|nr:hypothetical protein BASA83_009827 [Batrachochytrium salamandrivorans]